MSKINYFDKTGEEIEEGILQISEKMIGEPLLEGDERRAFIKAITYFMLQIGKAINYTGANNFLRYADEKTINLLGEMKGAIRKLEEKARTTIKFIRKANLTNVQGVPFGTKVAAGNLIFKTIESKSFDINESELLIEAEAEIPGENYNNLFPGQINILIDSIPFIVEIKNTTISTGGSDIESLESYRKRIREAPEGYSVAGPAGAYKFWAKTADSTISDVHVQSVIPGVVEIYPLIENGVIPSNELLNKVYELLNRDDIRPLTDKVEVKFPSQIEYTIDFTYYISKINEQYTNTIATKVNSIVDEFINETKSKLGVDINPDLLVYKLVNAGVKRVEFITPSFTLVTKTQVAKGVKGNINFGGVEDE